MDIFFSVFIYILNIIFVTFYTSLAYKREKIRLLLKVRVMYLQKFIIMID